MNQTENLIKALTLADILSEVLVPRWAIKENGRIFILLEDDLASTWTQPYLKLGCQYSKRDTYYKITPFEISVGDTVYDVEGNILDVKTIEIL